MTLYQIIFDFFSGTLGLSSSSLASMSSEIGGQSVNYSDWLCHTATIIVLCVLVFVAFKFVWWITRLIANAFMQRG